MRPLYDDMSQRYRVNAPGRPIVHLIIPHWAHAYRTGFTHGQEGIAYHAAPHYDKAQYASGYQHGMNNPNAMLRWSDPHTLIVCAEKKDGRTS